MHLDIALMYQRGVRLPELPSKRLRGDVQLELDPHSPLGRPALCAHVLNTTPGPDQLTRLHDARVEGIATLALVIHGYELIEGRLFPQAWHCRVPFDQVQVVLPWRDVPRSSLDKLI